MYQILARCIVPCASFLFLFAVLPAPAMAQVCSVAPLTTCIESPAVSLFVSQDPARPFANRLVWRAPTSDAISDEALGDPTADTDYAVCVFDGEIEMDTPGADGLVLELLIPSGPGWRVATKGYVYFTRDTSPDGARWAQLHSGPDGSAGTGVSAGGPFLVLDPLASVDGDLVISQLQGSNGTCFGAEGGTTPIRN